MQKHKRMTGKKFKLPQPAPVRLIDLQGVVESVIGKKGKHFEPERRLCAGRFGWVSHRFPIRGGIDMAEVICANMSTTNPLLAMLRKRGEFNSDAEVPTVKVDIDRHTI